jgi:hypothetical protein
MVAVEAGTAVVIEDMSSSNALRQVTPLKIGTVKGTAMMNCKYTNALKVGHTNHRHHGHLCI